VAVAVARVPYFVYSIYLRTRRTTKEVKDCGGRLSDKKEENLAPLTLQQFLFRSSSSRVVAAKSALATSRSLHYGLKVLNWTSRYLQRALKVMQSRVSFSKLRNWHRLWDGSEPHRRGFSDQVVATLLSLSMID